MTTKRNCSPGSHLSAADQSARNSQHDRGNVAPREKVFAILKGFGGKLSSLYKAFLKTPSAAASPANRSGAKPAKARIPGSVTAISPVRPPTRTSPSTPLKAVSPVALRTSRLWMCRCSSPALCATSPKRTLKVTSSRASPLRSKRKQ